MQRRGQFRLRPRPSWQSALRPPAYPCFKRSIIAEVVGVLANPAETVRSLAESRKELEKARQDLRDSRERDQLPPKHTFSPLPGFFGRERETRAIERVLSASPNLTVLFGASSVGKTALLREILSRDAYHCLHFDLRIAGFADLASLYYSLATQMEQYFASLPQIMGDGYEDFERESWAFKHDRLAMDSRLEKGGAIKTSDIAHVMELFQSSLLKYWNWDPQQHRKDEEEAAKPSVQQTDDVKSRLKGLEQDGKPESQPTVTGPDHEHDHKAKRIPVFFLDEAHKLPPLIQSDDAMKIILDALLVLTKQDRLCHCVHATSDPYYMTFLRQQNVAQHAKILSIGDCDTSETRRYFEEHLKPDIPDHLLSLLPSFDDIYNAFGGKLAHWQDYCTDFANADGRLSVRGSSHYLQAYALVNLHLVHAVPSQPSSEDEVANRDADTSPTGGFQIYSSLFSGSQHAAPAIGAGSATSASRAELVDILKTLRDGGWASDYFPLCRRLGAGPVDAAVRGRLCELRWTPTVSPEGDPGRPRKDFVAPQLVPITPVVRLAMKDVLEELQL